MNWKAVWQRVPQAVVAFGRRAFWDIPKRAGLEFADDDGFTLAAALAFYAMLSLAPLLVLTVTVFGYLGPDTRQQVIEQAKSLIGPEASKGIDLILANAHARRLSVRVSTIVWIVLLLVAATAVFAQLQYSLNRTFSVRTKQGVIERWFHKRFLSLLMVGGLGIVLLASIVASSIVTYTFHNIGLLVRVFYTLAPLLVFTLVFAMMFRILPDVHISWMDTAVGGLITAVLFYIGEYFIGWYLARRSTQSVYGATGSLIILLLWLYYSAVILFYGAELTQAIGNACGREIVPNENAEWDPTRKARSARP